MGDEAGLPHDRDSSPGFRKDDAGMLRRGDEQMAKDVTGAAVMAMGVCGNREIALVIVLRGNGRLAAIKRVVDMRRLAGRGFPAECRRQNRRQEHGKQSGGEGSQASAHARILAHKFRWNCGHAPPLR